MRMKMIKCKIKGHDWQMWDTGSAESGPITNYECKNCGAEMEPQYGM